MAKKSEETVILFTRYPEPGRAKTRLIQALGPDGAAELQRVMTERTVAEAREFAAGRAVNLEVHYAGGSAARMAGWLCGPGIVCRPQPDGPLGMRLARAFGGAFRAGMRRVMIIGCDCPALSARILAIAMDALRRNDLVLGPARDGGYYLVGLTRPAPRLFADIPWGSAEVLHQTLARAGQLNLSTLLLEPLSDVDRPDDLHHFRHYSRVE